MKPLLEKLNYKYHSIIHVLNAPDSFDVEIAEMTKISKVKYDLSTDDNIEFCLIFVTQKSSIKASMEIVNAIWNNDASVWYCYPKTSSKRYKCDFNRDNGWDEIRNYEVEPVSLVSIDQDWSALRFRKTKYIKKMIRSKSFALSISGKEKTSGK